MTLVGNMTSPGHGARQQVDKYHTQHLNNNYITDGNQSFVLAGPGAAAMQGAGKIQGPQSSKQAALKKKHF